MPKCKLGRKYPYVLKKKKCYTSPTSGDVRCGNLMLHCDSRKNEEYTMVRKLGGGTKRLYGWPRYYH